MIRVVVGRSLRSLEMQINEGVKGVSDQLNEVRTKPTAEAAEVLFSSPGLLTLKLYLLVLITSITRPY